MNTSSEGESFPGSVQSKCFSGRSARSGARAQARLRRSEQARGPEIGVTARSWCLGDRGGRAVQGALEWGHLTPYKAGVALQPRKTPTKRMVGEGMLSDNRHPPEMFTAPQRSLWGFGVTVATLVGKLLPRWSQFLKSGERSVSRGLSGWACRLTAKPFLR